MMSAETKEIQKTKKKSWRGFFKKQKKKSYKFNFNIIQNAPPKVINEDVTDDNSELSEATVMAEDEFSEFGNKR